MALGKIPCQLNGTPISNLAAVQPQFQRTVNQVAVLNGEEATVVTSVGPIKPQITLNFPILEDKQTFLRATGALLPTPPKFNLQIKLGTDVYNLLRGTVSNVNPSADQDATGSIAVQCMFEEVSLANPGVV